MRDFRRMVDRLIWDGMFQGRFEDKAFAIEVFNRHNEQVRRDVPPDRLLVFDVREGWEPLCAFLGVPVPEGKPFPHVNDTAQFRSQIQRGARIVRTVGYTVVTVVALILVWLASLPDAVSDREAWMEPIKLATHRTRPSDSQARCAGTDPSDDRRPAQCLRVVQALRFVQILAEPQRGQHLDCQE